LLRKTPPLSKGRRKQAASAFVPLGKGDRGEAARGIGATVLKVALRP